MNHKGYDNLQYVFACLSTHSRWVNAAIEDVKVIYKYFDLSANDKKVLRLFINNHGKKILNASLIMEEKRWREMLLMIKFVSKVVDAKELYHYWKEYLDLCDLTTHIPNTPIIESVKFLNFLSNRYSKHQLIDMIVRYELLKNSALSYEFIIDYCVNKLNLEDLLSNVENYNIELNPSLSMEKFKMPISKIIKNLQNEMFVSISCSSFLSSSLNQHENLIFFKNRNTGLARSLILKDEWFDLLSNIGSEGTLPSVVNHNKKNNFQFIRNMCALDVISVTSIGNL